MQDKQLFFEARHRHNQAAIQKKKKEKEKKNLHNTITETII